MCRIKSIGHRQILNSHVEFTTEFIIRLEDGSVGTGAAPKGETISIYEDRKTFISPDVILSRLNEAGCLGKDTSQQEFDGYLQAQIPYIGRNNAYSLSLAFFNALCARSSSQGSPHKPGQKRIAPYLCLNILNGGWHAYTNPVLSDFSEFMLVAKSTDLEEVISDHNEMQGRVRERLLTQTKTVIAGNPVHCFKTADNRECIEFLLNVRESLGFSEKFELMIDASAGDLWTADRYRFGITDHSTRSSEELLGYWMDIIRQYGLRFLEDPFHEGDAEGWQGLTTAQDCCHVIGDNFYSSDACRIEEGAANKCSHGVVIKPNQAGTVTAVQQAIEVAQRTGQIAITSHRSISTEETLIALLTCSYGVRYIKIGPLFTDYSSVVRLNEIIRLTEVQDGS